MWKVKTRGLRSPGGVLHVGAVLDSQVLFHALELWFHFLSIHRVLFN